VVAKRVGLESISCCGKEALVTIHPFCAKSAEGLLEKSKILTSETDPLACGITGRHRCFYRNGDKFRFLIYQCILGQSSSLFFQEASNGNVDMIHLFDGDGAAKNNQSIDPIPTTTGD
jgi:hypothetical protein